MAGPTELLMIRLSRQEIVLATRTGSVRIGYFSSLLLCPPARTAELSPAVLFLLARSTSLLLDDRQRYNRQTIMTHANREPVSVHLLSALLARMTTTRADTIRQLHSLITYPTQEADL